VQPSVVVGIDSKGFNLRVLRALAYRRHPAARENGTSVPPSASTQHPPPAPALVQYVAPSAWAFADADRRAAGLRGWLDHLLVLLPMEVRAGFRVNATCMYILYIYI